MGLDGVIEGRFMGEGIYLLLRFSLRVERRALGAHLLSGGPELAGLVPLETWRLG